MTGYITRTNGVNPALEISVDGYGTARYMGYTKAEAISRYRKDRNLNGKHLNLRDYTKPGMPQNLMEAVMSGLQLKKGATAR